MPTDKKLARTAASITRQPNQIILPLSGPPSSGKTSVKKYLDSIGFTTIPEFAGQIIKESKAGKHDLHPETCMYKFNNENFKRQVRAEKKLQHASLVLPDRSMYDPFAYFEMFELNLPEYLQVLPSKLYNTVFIFDRLPWVNDGIRHEGDKFAEAIEPYFKSTYTHRGVDLIHVPVFTFTEDDLTDAEQLSLSKETDYETRQSNLKQLLIDKSIAKRGQYIIGKIKANFPEVELPPGV